MRKAYALWFIVGLVAAGCASRGDLQALQGRVGAAETAIATKADKAEVKDVNERVTAVEKTAGAALADAAKKLSDLAAAKADKAEVDKRLAALDAAKAEMEKKVTAVAVETAAQRASIVQIEDQVKKQAARNAQLVKLVRAHRRDDKLEFVKHLVALGDKVPTGAVQCWGFASGKADLEDLLKRSPDCKKQLDELKEQITATKAEVLGVVGFEDRVKCKEPITDECKNVAKLRGEAVADYLGADKVLVSTEPPTDDIGASYRENRGVVVFTKKK